jgi:hypothetical protein
MEKGSKQVSCPYCGHDLHKINECNERVCDAAGDIDWCPCQNVGILKEVK